MKPKQIVLILTILAILMSIYLSWKSPVIHNLTKNKNINLLIVGTDWVDYAQHSDTIILLSYNPKNKLLDFISISRDTKISLPDIQLPRRVERINEAYAYYYRKEKSHLIASDYLRKIITNIFHNRIEIQYYFQIDYNTFRIILDALDGIYIEIEEKMEYDDYSGKLHINFTPGKWLLYGTKSLDLKTNKTYTGQGALEYVRFRDWEGDIGRIYRQQRFIIALFNKLRDLKTVFRLPYLLKPMFTMPNTNISLIDAIGLLFELKNMDFDNVRMTRLPGKPYKYFWQIDDIGIEHILDLIYGPETDIDYSKIKLEVFNASSHQGAALEVTRKLRDFGFDVVEYGNYPTRQKKTIVLDRIGNLKAIKNIAKILNAEETFIRYDSNKFVDISVYIGEDYKNTQSESK